MGLKDKYYEFKDKHFRKDFFISYHNSPGKGENCVAKKIHQVLKRKCYSDYYNPEHFEFNEQYAERLHRKVKECKVFIWLITDDYFKLRRERDGSIARNWFLAEILWAYKYQKRICIVIDKETYKDVTMKEVADCFQQGFEPLCNYKNYDAFDDTDKELVKRFLDQLFNGGSVRSNRICTFGAYDKIKIEKESGQKRGSRKKEIEKAAKKIIKGAKNENKNAKKSVNGNKPIRVYRKKLWLIHTMVLVLSLAGGVAYKVITTDPTVWDGEGVIDVPNFEEAYSGEGTEESPYKIETAKQLAYMAYVSQYDSQVMEGKHFRLENDITLNSNYDSNKYRWGLEKYAILSKNNEKNITHANVLGYWGKVIPNKDATNVWIPIGNKEHPFGGFFDGNNKTIRGLYIDNTENMQGLFGCCTENSQITNLNLEGGIVQANDYVGAIAGDMKGCIDHCNVSTISVEAHAYVGSIAGSAALLTNSMNGGLVFLNENEKISDKNKKYFGGLVGKCDYIVNSSANKVYLETLDHVECVGGVAGMVEKNIHNIFAANINMIAYEPEFYFDNKNAVVKVCDVIGEYGGKVSRNIEEKNVRYAGDNVIIFQVDKKKYIDAIDNNGFLLFKNALWTQWMGGRMKSRYKGKYGLDANLEDINAGLVKRKDMKILEKKLIRGFSEFSLHDYSERDGKYNLISKVIQCGESSVEEFDNYAKKIDDKEIKNALDKYGIQLHPWNLRGKVMEVS